MSAIGKSVETEGRFLGAMAGARVGVGRNAV